MILNGTGDNLQAFMAGAAATTNPSFFVTYADINTTTSALVPDSAGGALNGTTDVNLASGVSGSKRMLKNLSICNIDTATVTVTVQFEDGTDRPIQSAIPIPVGKTLYWSLETGWVIQPAEPLGFRGALVTRTTAFAVLTGVSTAVEFDAETYDEAGWHDNSTNNTRLTVPANVSKIQLSGNMRVESDSTGRRSIFFGKNGSTFLGSTGIDAVATNVTDMTVTVDCAVVEGDYFELFLFQDSGSTLDVQIGSILPQFSVVVLDPH